MQNTQTTNASASAADHVFYTIADWRADVADGATLKGYQDWVQYQIDTHGGQKAHCAECGTPLETDALDAAEDADRMCVDCTQELHEVEENLYKLVETTFTNYDFGGEIVEATGGWEYDGDTSWTRAVFLANQENPDEASIKKLFTVTLKVNMTEGKTSIETETYFR